ncbi:MAG: hypothetical protein ACYCU3_13165 [Streptosporangiaceae bacterium]
MRRPARIPVWLITSATTPGTRSGRSSFAIRLRQYTSRPGS